MPRPPAAPWQDYTVLLPHTSPNMPTLSTTFTDLCPALVETLMMGRQAAEKRRRVMQDGGAGAGDRHP